MVIYSATTVHITEETSVTATSVITQEDPCSLAVSGTPLDFPPLQTTSAILRRLHEHLSGGMESPFFPRSIAEWHLGSISCKVRHQHPCVSDNIYSPQEIAHSQRGTHNGPSGQFISCPLPISDGFSQVSSPQFLDSQHYSPPQI